MNVILSDEQIKKCIPFCSANCDCKTCGTGCITVAKVQAHHLLNLLNELCTEHDKPGPYFKYRKNCIECMKEIEEEIEK